MPAKRVPAPATIETNDNIPLNRSADRDRRGAFGNGLRRFSELLERLINSLDQGWKFARCDLVTGDISRNNFGREAQVDCLRRLIFWHGQSPDFGAKQHD